MEKTKQSGFKRFMSGYGIVILTGLLIGAAAVALSRLGNPKNMGFCIACFLRDIAGTTKLHNAHAVQYFRPEIVGLVIGAMIWAMIKKEWKPTGGSSPVTRFFIGAFVMIGALVFLGCPLRMVIRIGGGDLNALIGLVGFIVGIVIGTVPLRLGFSLNRAYKQSRVEGLILPIMLTGLFILFLAVPALFEKSVDFEDKGPGKAFAPWFIALTIALVIGAFCQQSRLCMAGGIRDVVLFKDFRLISGFAAIIVAVLLGNLILGNFTAPDGAPNALRFTFEGQPIAHSDGWMNFLGMLIVGYGSVLLGGCPLRQLILTGEGNSDSGITVLGYIAGAAFAHNFGLAGTADATVDGTFTRGSASVNAIYVLITAFVIFTLIAIFNTKRRKA